MKHLVWTLLSIMAVLVAAVCWLWETVREERKEKRRTELELDTARGSLLIEKDSKQDWKSRALNAEDALRHEALMRNRVCVCEIITDEAIQSANIDAAPYVEAKIKRKIGEIAMECLAIESHQAPGGGGLQIVGTLQLRKPDEPGRIEDHIRKHWEELRRGSVIKGCHGGSEEGDLLRAVHGDETQEGAGSSVSEGTEGEAAKVL